MTDSENLTNSSTRSAADQPSLRAERQGSTVSSVQIMFAVILAVGLMLAINFSSRIIADRQLQEVRFVVVQEIDLLRREQAALIDQLAYVESNAYVEAWARSEGRMVREGDVLVLPVPSTLSLSTPEVVVVEVADVQTTRPRPETWQVWWALLLDTPPPGNDGS